MRAKVLILVAVAVACVCASALAQGVGAIMLYTDQAGTECRIQEQPTDYVQIWIYHEFHNGVTGAQFALQHTGTGLTHLTDLNPLSTPFLITGKSTDGVSVSYGSCFRARLPFLSVVYEVFGPAEHCSRIDVVPSPRSLSGTIEGIDCMMIKHVADTSCIRINDSDSECSCARTIASLPTDPSTWGRVKSLYE